MGRGFSPRNTLLPHVCYHLEFGRSRSNGKLTSVIKEIHLKNLTRRAPPFTQTQFDPPLNYDFLLTFHSRYGSMSYRFRDKRRFQSKIANFPHLSIFDCGWTPGGVWTLQGRAASGQWRCAHWARSGLGPTLNTPSRARSGQIRTGPVRPGSYFRHVLVPLSKTSNLY